MGGISVLLAHIHFIQFVLADLHVHSKNISQDSIYQAFYESLRKSIINYVSLVFNYRLQSKIL
jgi:hypothetical protein